MNYNFLIGLLNMSVEEIKKQLDQFVKNDDELDAICKGKEIIDDLLKLRTNSSSNVGNYLALYTAYKLKNDQK